MAKPETDSLPPSLWAASAKPGRSFKALEGEARADVVIVGGGYTGLSAALHLAEQGRDVAVIEAAEPGWGASGRNGGQVIPGVKYDPDALEAMLGPDLGPRVVRTVGGSADAVFDLIRRHGIECDANQSGWIQPAHTPSALAGIESRARQWKARGADVAMLDKAETAKLLGTGVYHGAWIDRRGGSLQPLDYARGLAATASSRGARIFVHSPARTLESSGSGWRVETAKGAITAERLIIATNAYTDLLWPGLARSVIPVISFQIATEPLDASVHPAILPGGHVATDTRRVLRYFRRDKAGRLVFGSRGPFLSRQPQASDAKGHYAAVREIFPQLDGVRFEYHWGGKVAMTPDHLPHIHELAPGLYAGLGCNGRGIAIATVMGQLLAARASGKSAEEIDYPTQPMKALPLHGFNRFAVELVAQYYRLRDAWG